MSIKPENLGKALLAAEEHMDDAINKLRKGQAAYSDGADKSDACIERTRHILDRGDGHCGGMIATLSSITDENQMLEAIKPEITKSYTESKLVGALLRNYLDGFIRTLCRKEVFFRQALIKSNLPYFKSHLKH